MSPTRLGGRNRTKQILATVSVIVATVGGAALIPTINSGGGGGATSGTANVWIDQNGGTCVRNATAGAYVDSQACTRDGAEALWQKGDTVTMKGGTYSGSWVINRKAALANLGCDPYAEWGATNTTDCVHINVASAETVTMTGVLEVDSGGIWIDGTRTGTYPSTTGLTWNFNVLGGTSVENNEGSVDNTVLNGVNSTALGAYGSDRIMFRNGASGGRQCVNWTGANVYQTWPMTGAWAGGISISTFEPKIQDRNGTNATNIVYDGVFFHDVYRTNGGANPPGGGGECHDGALFVASVVGWTIRNSVFTHNWVYNIQIQNCCGAPAEPSAAVIENNWFFCSVDDPGMVDIDGQQNVCSGQAAIQWDEGTASNYLIRYNSFANSSPFECYVTSCSYSNVRLIGNIASKPTSGTNNPCGASGVTSAYNAYEGGTCGANDTTVPSLSGAFTGINPAGTENMHLASTGSSPNNLVPNSGADYAITRDIDGTTRPVGANRDAGADEQ